MAIDVSELDSFSIFPGQVAAVKGINNGKRFILSQMLPPLPPPHRPPPVDGVSLLIAAGPFSIASATSYEPFKDLLQQVKAMRPSAVILVRAHLPSCVLNRGVCSFLTSTRGPCYLSSNTCLRTAFH
jgi:hypothetical protein